MTFDTPDPGPQAPIRIVLADDHTVVREGIRRILQENGGFQIVGEAADGREARKMCEELRPDVALVDLLMPFGGLPMIHALRALPGTRILVLSMHRDAETCREVLRLGVGGYTTKTGSAEELAAAVRAVSRGELYLHPSMTRSVLGDQVLGPVAEEQDPWLKLSERQRQVVRRVAQGYTNREIAEELGLSIKTVETYRARAMEALHLVSRVDLVRFLVRQGLLEDGL